MSECEADWWFRGPGDQNSPGGRVNQQQQVIGEEQAETSSRGWGLQSAPYEEDDGKGVENLSATRRPLVTGESSELILLSQRVGKAFLKKSVWRAGSTADHNSKYQLSPSAYWERKKQPEGRGAGLKAYFAASFHLNAK